MWNFSDFVMKIKQSNGNEEENPEDNQPAKENQPEQQLGIGQEEENQIQKEKQPELQIGFGQEEENETQPEQKLGLGQEEEDLTQIENQPKSQFSFGGNQAALEPREGDLPVIPSQASQEMLTPLETQISQQAAPDEPVNVPEEKIEQAAPDEPFSVPEEKIHNVSQHSLHSESQQSITKVLPNSPRQKNRLQMGQLLGLQKQNTGSSSQTLKFEKSQDSERQKQPQLQQQDLVLKIKESILEYEKIVKAARAAGKDVTQAEALLDNLRQQLSWIKQHQAESVTKLDTRSVKNIQKSFKYYASQQQLLGKTPDFSSIQENSDFLTKGKFIAFAKDHGVVGQTTKDQKFLTAKEASKIYDKVTNFARKMTLEQFDVAITELAKYLFTPQYDSIHNSNIAETSDSEKRRMLIKLTQLAKKPEFRDKGIGRKFGAQSTRIPENDLAKGYIYPPDRPQLIAGSSLRKKPLPAIAAVFFANPIKKAVEETKKKSEEEAKKSLKDKLRKRSQDRRAQLQQQKQGKEPRQTSWTSRPFTLEQLTKTNVQESKKLEEEIYELIVDDPEEDAILERMFPSSMKNLRSPKAKEELNSIEESLYADRQLASHNTTNKPSSRHTSSQPLLPRIVSSTQRLPKIRSNVTGKTMTQSRKNSLVELAKATYHPAAKGRRALLRALKTPDDH